MLRPAHIAIFALGLCLPTAAQSDRTSDPKRQTDSSKKSPEEEKSTQKPGSGQAGEAAPQDGKQTMQKIVVEGRAESLIGVADSATEGRVGQAQISQRPILRPGEILETVPGLIATQHSGAGKANQFFLRGFNLDHGTDLRTTVGGIPVNMPSHGHGQGYTDLNFMIPELVETVSFRKGPYAARDGDFSSAGSVDIDYFRTLDRGILRFEAGSYDYTRGLFADSVKIGPGDLLMGAEVLFNDGRWENPDDFTKTSAVLRYTTGDANEGFSITGMAYEADWTATDHVAKRAVDSGLIGRFGTLDPTSGGATDRYSLAAEWSQQRDDTRTRLLAYGVYYEFDLFSNFTYLLSDPVNGDQFEQTDRRWAAGLEAEKRWFHQLGGRGSETAVGAQFRSDFIKNGLHTSARRVRLATVRVDDIDQASYSLWVENKTSVNEWFRTSLGARVDHYTFDVSSDRAINSGKDDSTVFSPRAGLAFGPFADTEIYLNGGFGFHSNDARGVTSRDDPTTPAPNDATPVTPLPRSKGAEIGFRTTAVPGLQSTVSVWFLDNDSELVFVGDAGSTEASRASERYGVEFANFYQPLPWLTFDVDVALSRAFFKDDDPAGRRVPNSVETTANAAATISYEKVLASLRMRHFGTRPLVEDNSARSSVTTLFNLRFGYQYSESAGFGLDVLNLFDEKDADIQYFYESRLAGEPAAGVGDIHFHPVEPLALRFFFQSRF